MKVHRTEQGATLVTIALSLTAVLGVSSLAIDGGRAFTARRQSQNAADSAALAGAEALFAYQYAAATKATRDTTAVATAVSAKLLQNGMTTTSCQLVDELAAVLGSCTGATDAQLVASSGVQAGGTFTQATALAGVMGINSIKAAASATAEVQPLVATAAPFIVCGAAHTGWNILNNDGTINSSANNLTNIAIEGPQVPDCGAGSSTFKGKAAPGAGLVPAGSWEGVTTGNGYNSTAANAVASLAPCPSDITTLTGTCGMIIPVAAAAQGVGTATQLQIVTFATFNVTSNGSGGNPRFSGTYVAPAYLATQGQSAFGVHCITGNQICMVKLAS